MVPAGLHGLATIRPSGGGSSRSSIATLGWNRVSGPASRITGCMPEAVRMFTYGG